MRRSTPLFLIGWSLLLAAGVFGLHFLKWTHAIEDPLKETMLAAGGQLAALVGLVLIAFLHRQPSESQDGKNNDSP